MYQKDKLPELEVSTPNLPMTQERQDLWDAAQLLKRHGHCKGQMVNEAGNMCWGGAIAKATSDNPIHWYNDRFNAAVLRFNQVHGFKPSTPWMVPTELDSPYLLTSEPVKWNNASETTAEEVIAKLEYAALS